MMDMSDLFNKATTFNGDISKWDVSSVTNMGYVLSERRSMAIFQWNVSSVTGMSGMFCGQAFNGDISEWDVSSVTTMSQMFYGAQRSMAIFPNGMSLRHQHERYVLERRRSMRYFPNGMSLPSPT
jgi:surface protein